MTRALVRPGSLVIAAIAAITTVILLSQLPEDTKQGWSGLLVGCAALGLLLSAAVAWSARSLAASVAAAGAALSWTALLWTVATVHTSSTAVGFGMVVSPFLVPFLTLLLRDDLAIRRSPRIRIGVPTLAFLGIGATGVVRALVYEPLLDAGCGPYCGRSPVVVHTDLDLAARLDATGTVLTLLVGTGLSLIIVGDLVRRRRTTRAGVIASLAGAGGAALFAAAAAFELRFAGAPSSEAIAIVLGLGASACWAVAISVSISCGERIAVRRGLAEVTRALAEHDEPIEVEPMLRDALGDRTLQIGYWLDDVGFVGPDGRSLGAPSPGRQQTALVIRGRTVAILVHEEGSLPAELVRESLGPQARLAIQNESLELELRRHISDLRASRQRIVDTAEAERRRLERDLHDGAQQSLLALSFELRRGERAAERAGDPVSTVLFGATRDVAARTLEQLRGLASGIHSATLTGAGLEDALRGFAADRTPVPAFRLDVGGRLPEPTEAAVFSIVTALVDATRTGEQAKITIHRSGDVVFIRSESDDEPPAYVLDRVGAAGGSRVPDERGLELVLPCV
jgi:signal transduction histidine kinase